MQKLDNAENGGAQPQHHYRSWRAVVLADPEVFSGSSVAARSAGG